MHVVWNLRGGMDRKLVALSIISGKGCVGLGLHLADFGAFISFLTYQIGVFKTFVDFANIVFNMAFNIIRPF